MQYAIIISKFHDFARLGSLPKDEFPTHVTCSFIRINYGGCMSKKCISCDQILSDKAIKDACKSCRHKEACKKWVKTNQEKFQKYQEKYRTENKELCNKRVRDSYWKNEEEYRLRNKIHYREVNGIPIDSPFKKRRNGEGTIDSSGYKTISKKGHPNAMDEKGRIREHIFIMSEFLKRPLTKNQSVHHKNGIRDDNRIENLELWHKGQPPGQRLQDKIEWAIDFLKNYGYKVVKE